MTIDVAAFLEGLGLGQYAPAFAANDIDAALLVQLSDADLRDIGVASLGHRKRLLAAIAGLGAATGSPSVPAPNERRQVTILFADLSGFTRLSQALDPEEVRDLVERYTGLVDRVIVEYGGCIDKHIGDAVMALFGAPIAHDNDPLRAVRAAVEIHEALARLGASFGRPLQAHIGIAVGEVVAGALGRVATQDYTVLGDSVNLAARLVGAASPGETLISGAVQRALGGRGICDALGERTFKGIEAPVEVWRLRAVTAEPSAARTPFVGRAAELEQFKGVVGTCLDLRAGQVFYVRGEAGIGKTRLVEEMRRLAEARGFSTHRGLVLDFGAGKGQDAIREVLRSLVGLAAGADADDRRSAVERALALGRVSPDQLMFLQDMLDVPQSGETRGLYDAMDNAARNAGKRALVAAIVEDACRHAPTLVIVEDVHWADTLTLGHLAAIARAIADQTGLLVMTSRVESDPIGGAWRASCRDTPMATIELGPLRREESLTFAASLIATAAQVGQACIERSGGNPLFLEQLLRAAEEAREDAIPASIQSLVLARMDRLPAHDRKAFQAASVIGQRFDLAALQHLLGVHDYDCAGLLAHALVLPEGEGFLFAHALIREAAYSSLLRARRRDLHRLAAEWFAGQDPALHAQHLDRAEDEGAAKAYLDAAIAARAAFRAETALALVARGLEIVRQAGERHALTCFKGELQRDLGDVAGSIGTYREAIASASDDISLAQAQLGLAEGLRVSEGLGEALELLDRAQGTVERYDLLPEMARLHHLRGNILFPLGRIEECRAEHERGLAYARRLGSPEAEAQALGGLGDAAYAQGRMRSAFENFSRCVALSREHGFGRIEVANRSMVGFSRLYLNQARQAREDGGAAARAAMTVGQLRAALLGETMGVLASVELGDVEEASRYLERSTKLADQLGARRFELQNAALRGRLLLLGGRCTEATEILRGALADCAEIGWQFSGPLIISGLSRAIEEPEERLRLLAQGEEILRQGSVGHNHLWFHRDAIEVMLEVGDAAGARRYASSLESYTAVEPLPWADLVIARARALAACLDGRADDDLRGELQRIRDALHAAGIVPFAQRIEAVLADLEPSPSGAGNRIEDSMRR